MATKWIPLESNPDVLTNWARKLGLSKNSSFTDVYGLDKELLDMVPQPTRAVLLLFPVKDAIISQRRADDAKIKETGQPDLDPTMFFIKQTIPNACGTIGVLHAIINSGLTIGPTSPLSRFVEQGQDQTPEERAALLEKTPLFAEVHQEVAQQGQSAVPTNLDTDLHFTVFVHAPNLNKPGESRLIELDGGRATPIDLGPSTDLLADAANQVRKKYMAVSTSMHFSMIALSGN